MGDEKVKQNCQVCNGMAQKRGKAGSFGMATTFRDETGLREP